MTIRPKYEAQPKPSKADERQKANADKARRHRARLRGEDVPKRKPGNPAGDAWTRFEAKFTRSEGCWIWNGSRYTNGYGSFYFNGGPKPAHRVAYTLLRGPIPDGMTIDHLCRTPLCVNPSHMEIVTRAENARRAHESRVIER